MTSLVAALGRVSGKAVPVVVFLLTLVALPIATLGARQTVAFDAMPIGPLPADAAFHHRAAAPEAGLHLVTQHINDDIRLGNNHSKGRFQSARPHYDLLLDFHVELHEQLAPLDDAAVSHFVHKNEFHMDSHYEKVRVGAVLAGTHNGNWSFTAGSAQALSEASDTHAFGGFAYLQQVTAVETLANGKTRVQTSDAVEANAPS